MPEELHGFVDHRGILPTGEINDARILADTAIAEIPMLVTIDNDILQAGQIALSLPFEDAGLPLVHPFHPARLTRSLRERDLSPVRGRRERTGIQ